MNWTLITLAALLFSTPLFAKAPPRKPANNTQSLLAFKSGVGIQEGEYLLTGGEDKTCLQGDLEIIKDDDTGRFSIMLGGRALAVDLVLGNASFNEADECPVQISSKQVANALTTIKTEKCSKTVTVTTNKITAFPAALNYSITRTVNGKSELQVSCALTKQH